MAGPKNGSCQLILDTLRTEGPRSPPELAKRLHLDACATAANMHYLRKTGRLETAGTRQSHTGRPATVYRICALDVQAASGSKSLPVVQAPQPEAGFAATTRHAYRPHGREMAASEELERARELLEANGYHVDRMRVL